MIFCAIIIMEVISTAIPERIKEIRKEVNLTQREFAEKIGLKQNTVAAYEIGATQPSERTLCEICRVFGYNVDWLVNGTGEKKRQLSRAEEINAYIGRICQDENADFQRRIVAAMAKIPAELWPEIEKFARRIVDGEKG